jgi:hypothetical protein
MCRLLPERQDLAQRLKITTLSIRQAVDDEDWASLQALVAARSALIGQLAAPMEPELIAESAELGEAAMNALLFKRRQTGEKLSHIAQFRRISEKRN